jgi:hypothetical protein
VPAPAAPPRREEVPPEIDGGSGPEGSPTP